MNKTVQRLDDYDFGFSLMSEDQLDVVQKAKGKVDENKETITHLSKEVEKQSTKAQRIYSMVLPLLDNLASDPSKEYIYWPTRVEKIREFKEKLKQVLEE